MLLPAPLVGTEEDVLDFGLPERTEPKEESSVTVSQQAPEHLTVELGDAFLLLFKTMTGR
jgi:hypothetical protein